MDRGFPDALKSQIANWFNICDTLAPNTAKNFISMTATTNSRYVTREPEILSGEPIIQGTRTPVRAIVENWRLGIRPEEIPLHLPHLTLAQVFDALSFYLDNQSEINEYIERNHVPDELVHPAIKARLNQQ
jgi:uncharacterized protein (DUF433 family)